MTSKARQIYRQSGHWPQILMEISSELDEILRWILLPKLIHPKWSETKDQTDSWILTLKWFVVCTHQCERGWAVKAREHVPQSLEHSWLSLLRLVQQVLSPAAALERVSKRGKEGTGGEREKTKKARWQGGWASPRLSRAGWSFHRILGRRRCKKGNREMARSQLQCKPGCFLTVQQEMMCLIPWNRVPLITGAALPLLEAGVKWKSGGATSPLLSSVPPNAALTCK